MNYEPRPMHQPGFETQQPQETSGLAIAALVLGLIALPGALVLIGFPIAIVGLVLGIIALVQISKPGEPTGGKGMAIAGVALSGTTIVMLPLLIGIMLPALGAARRTARQMQSSTQARGIHAGLILYAQGNNTYYPDQDSEGNPILYSNGAILHALLEDNYFTVEYVISPLAEITPPSDYDSWPDKEQIAWLNRNASFVVVPGLHEDNDPAKVAVFMKLLNPETQNGTSVGFNDNKVQWMQIEDASELIKQQTGKSLEEWSGY